MASIAKFDDWQNTAGIRQKTVLGFGYYHFPSTVDTYISISGDTDYDTAITLTYTPKYSNSLLYVYGTAQTRMNSGAVGMSGGIKRDGTKQIPNLNVGGQDFFYKTNTTNFHYNIRSNIVVTANSTASTTFLVWVRPYGGTGEWSYGWGQNFICLFEIAQ